MDHCEMDIGHWRPFGLIRLGWLLFLWERLFENVLFHKNLLLRFFRDIIWLKVHEATSHKIKYLTYLSIPLSFMFIHAPCVLHNPSAESLPAPVENKVPGIQTFSVLYTSIALGYIGCQEYWEYRSLSDGISAVMGMDLLPVFDLISLWCHPLPVYYPPPVLLGSWLEDASTLGVKCSQKPWN